MVSVHLKAGEAVVFSFCSLRFRLPCILPVYFVAFCFLTIYVVLIYQKKKVSKCFCGEKNEKDLEFYSVVYLLDGLEGNE